MRSSPVVISGRRHRLAVIVAAVLAVIVCMPANASVILRDPYSGGDTWSYDDCGFGVDVTGTYGGVFSIRTGPDPDTFFAHDSYWFREIHRRRSDGRIGIVEGKGTFREVQAIPVSGTVYEFRAVNAGQLFTVRDADGDLLLRDSGMIDATVRFDTLGDQQPGGELIAELDTVFRGRFPSLGADLCAMWTA
ncbi:MAG TPA: hypothetical protein VFY23_04580 [Candidatus Limnocylindrales bacterium]|nr:hypothetical protein [Candidatus Limnocylindrales bacterium]